MVGESCFEGVLCKTDVSLRCFVVICFDQEFLWLVNLVLKEFSIRPM